MGACTELGHLMIVTELMPKGSLGDLLANTKIEITLLQKIKMMKDIALGMNWLHCSKPPIIHRDLKPSNVLVCIILISLVFLLILYRLTRTGILKFVILVYQQ